MTEGSGVPPNKAMKLTRLSAAPGWLSNADLAEGAASCPRRRETAGTASQLIASVRRTREAPCRRERTGGFECEVP
jgi:hypothetical protein